MERERERQRHRERESQRQTGRQTQREGANMLTEGSREREEKVEGGAGELERNPPRFLRSCTLFPQVTGTRETGGGDGTHRVLTVTTICVLAAGRQGRWGGGGVAGRGGERGCQINLDWNRL